MERGLIVLVAALVVFMSSGVHSQANINRTGCGVTKLCVETPENCDPTGSNDCLFASVVSGASVAPNGAELSFELRGNSGGYVAVGLTQNASEGTTMVFLCAQNTSEATGFFFSQAQLNNPNPGLILLSATNATLITSMVNGSEIKCTFTVPNVNASNTRGISDTTFSVVLGSGTYASNALGVFNTSLVSRLLNLADPTSNTAVPSSSGAVQPHVVLLLLTALALSVMLRA